jgi:cytochrome c1
MKKILLLSAIFISTVAFSQSDKYVGAMKSALDAMKDAKTGDDMADAAAKFERIGDAEKTQWLPYYYAALIKSRMSMQGFGGDKDKVADEAEVLINKAQAIDKNSENFCVVYMVATARMLVDPAGRYMQYMAALNAAIADAQKADPTNPRPYMLQANAIYKTPKQYGGGCENAKPIALKAQGLYAAFKPASELHPNWGKDIVDQIVTDCK